jgi:hypothetical protein
MMMVCPLRLLEKFERSGYLQAGDKMAHDKYRIKSKAK